MNEVLYLTVPTQAGLKRLYRFEGKADGTVIVSSASKPRLAVSDSILDLVQITEHEFPESIPNSHLSVHASRCSATLNQINFPEDNFPQFTQSIKKENRFTPIVVRVFGDLTQSKHDFQKSKYRTQEFPEIQTDKDTLVLGLVLGPKDKEFRWQEEHPSNLTKLEFSDFNIWLIWSLFNRPALKHSVDFKLKGGSLEEPLGGFEEFEIYNFYTLSKSIYTDAFFDSFPVENSL